MLTATLRHLCKLLAVIRRCAVPAAALLAGLLPAHTFGQDAAPDAIVGKRVRNINIVVVNIFDRPDDAWLFRTANSLKVATRERTIRRRLLFRADQEITPFQIAESLRNLRTLRFIRNPQIHTAIDGPYVDVTVRVQDTWTFIPQLSVISGTGGDKFVAGVSESNVLGYGKRAEFLYEEDERRESLNMVWDDRRLLGTNIEMLAAWFDRNDGTIMSGKLGRPYRSFLDKDAWALDSGYADSIGRLFEAGSENYIFRQRIDGVSALYSWSSGDPQRRLTRWSGGYAYQSAAFEEADAEDYEILDLNPAELVQGPQYLAEDRRLTGPVAGWQRLQPDFFSSDSLDRFTRVQDVDLGSETSILAQVVSELWHADRDALLLSLNRRYGLRLDQTEFIRGEMGLSTRLEEGGPADTLLRAEGRYYRLLGPCSLGGLGIGAHTWAASFYIDYGENLDRDRQLHLGSESVLRGYKARAFNGDKALALNLEDRIQLFTGVARLFHVGLVTFADFGGASYDSLGELLRSGLYGDVGIGLRFGFPRSAGESVLRIDLAFPVRAGPEESDAFEPRIVLSGGQVFDVLLRSEQLGTRRASAGVGFDR